MLKWMLFVLFISILYFLTEPITEPITHRRQLLFYNKTMCFSVYFVTQM